MEAPGFGLWYDVTDCVLIKYMSILGFKMLKIKAHYFSPLEFSASFQTTLFLYLNEPLKYLWSCIVRIFAPERPVHYLTLPSISLDSQINRNTWLFWRNLFLFQEISEFCLGFSNCFHSYTNGICLLWMLEMLLSAEKGQRIDMMKLHARQDLRLM